MLPKGPSGTDETERQALAALADDLGSVPRTHIVCFMATCNSSSEGSKVLFRSECTGQKGPKT